MHYISDTEYGRVVIRFTYIYIYIVEMITPTAQYVTGLPTTECMYDNIDATISNSE